MVERLPGASRMVSPRCAPLAGDRRGRSLSPDVTRAPAGSRDSKPARPDLRPQVDNWQKILQYEGMRGVEWMLEPRIDGALVRLPAPSQRNCGQDIEFFYNFSSRSYSGELESGQDAASRRPRCGQFAATARPIGGHGLANPRPRCGRPAANRQPARGHGAARAVWLIHTPPERALVSGRAAR